MQFAAAHALVDFDRRSLAPQPSYVWDASRPQAPLLTLEAHDDALLDVAYAPRVPHSLAATLLSGRVGVWDTRRRGDPALLCPEHIAHRDLARCLLFINTKSGQEFFSSGPDGVCKWWDMRNMNEVTDELIIDLVKSSTEPQNMATANGVSALEYEPTIPSRFMVGTENGLVICGNRKGKTAFEKLPAKVLERESKRERILEARLRELRLRQKQPERTASASALPAPADLAAVAAQYALAVRRELAALS